MRIVMDGPQSSPPRSALPVCFGVVALAGNLLGQSAVSLPRDTSFFKDPGGVRLGTLVAGARMTPGRVNAGHTQVTIDGWIFTASTRPDPREGFDLSVRLPEGENLRDAPGGAIIARAVQGTLFKKLGVNGGWTRVERAVWVESSALAARSSAARRLGDSASDTSAGSRTAEAPRSRDAETPAETAAESRATLRSGVVLQRTPDGAEIARTLEPADVTIGQINGDWVRVRFDGWVRRGEVDSAVTPRPAITGAMLRENPERYVGQTVEWRVQFLALQHADELRPEMPAGQPYLLVRGPLPESGFAYVAISPAQAEELRSLRPLEELRVTVTVRAGRTRYLATPIVELVRRAR